MRNEADTKAELVEPKLKAAGWTDSRITREFFYQKNHVFTKGRLYLIGNETRRGQPRRVDYLLRYTEAFPIAVVEAEAEDKPPNAGLEQAKGYAQDLGVPFAYSTNGHGIVEYDFFTKSSQLRETFPKPGELWERWILNTGIKDISEPRKVAEARAIYHPGAAAYLSGNPLYYPYCPKSQCGKEPYYFQEVAVRRVIERVMKGQRRILLSMATGSGKTFVAFQICWKLKKSGWLDRLHPDRPGRILFLADRIVLRRQAYNEFSPFSDGTSDPRYIIEGHPPNLNREIYFGIYQTLWSEDELGYRLFEKFPKEFFALVIIDECHRSGFGTWREILDHFSTAIHLGMTATPKRSDNIDTYDYFCREELEEPVDLKDLSKGFWHPPAYQYSLGQGIEDGYLAPYKVHWVRTTIDKEGLHIYEAIEQGAEVFVPLGADLKEVYYTPQFEREITIPDRTKAMCAHLAGLLRRFGPMEKTMVFCVDMAHARLVAEELQNHFNYLGYDNYAVPIISEERNEGEVWLNAFAAPEKKTPVVATTAELLTTGVDVPPCRNIVFMKTLSSPVLFKQIVGRGSRLCEDIGKTWFRIIDYTGATRLFDEWDKPPSPPPEHPAQPFTAQLRGVVVHAESGVPLVGASVIARIGPNIQQGPILTDEDGSFHFTGLPQGSVTLIVRGHGFRQRQLKVETIANETVSVIVELKPETVPVEKIRVEGLEVTIADEALFTIEATGEQLSLSQYKDYTRGKVVTFVSQKVSGPSSPFSLRAIWVDPEKRNTFLDDLHKAGIHPEVLAIALGQPDADTFDVLSHIAFGRPLLTRSQRATAFRNRQQGFLQRYKEEARFIILELLEKYRLGGVEQIEPRIFSVFPFREMGGIVKINPLFGGPERLRLTLAEIRSRLYEEV